EDNHSYYVSRVFGPGEARRRGLWVDMAAANRSQVKIHGILSNTHRQASRIVLSFDFPFYGHPLRQVTIATGGFIFVGDVIHRMLTATQYIAPLMANFNPSYSRNSTVQYLDNGTVFVVQWDQVYLQGKEELGSFTFQAALHSSGRIVFGYKEVREGHRGSGRAQHSISELGPRIFPWLSPVPSPQAGIGILQAHLAAAIAQPLLPVPVKAAGAPVGRREKNRDYPGPGNEKKSPNPALVGAGWEHLDKQGLGREFPRFYPHSCAGRARMFPSAEREKGRERFSKKERGKTGRKARDDEHRGVRGWIWGALWGRSPSPGSAGGCFPGTGSSPPARGAPIPAGTVVGIVVAVVLLAGIILAGIYVSGHPTSTAALFFIERRPRRWPAMKFRSHAGRASYAEVEAASQEKEGFVEAEQC
ncbi:PLDX1 protein, partial [Brachypodius atriceps]|nr:PLDX1 protein [Brachypodius atriceps]